MKTLYVHGPEGNYCDNVQRGLKELGDDVCCPGVDYTKLAPNTIINQLVHIDEIVNCDRIVGVSFGCFFAKILSIKLKKPCILINKQYDPSKCEEVGEATLHPGMLDSIAKVVSTFKDDPSEELTIDKNASVQTIKETLAAENM